MSRYKKASFTPVHPCGINQLTHDRIRSVLKKISDRICLQVDIITGFLNDPVHLPGAPDSLTDAMGELRSFLEEHRHQLRAWDTFLQGPVFPRLQAELLLGRKSRLPLPLIFTFVMDIFQIGADASKAVCRKLAGAPIFHYIYSEYPSHRRNFPDLDRTTVIASLLRVCDRSFADLVEYVQSRSSWLDPGLVHRLPRIFRAFLNNAEIPRHEVFYQPQAYLYRAFIRCQLHHEIDVLTCPPEEQVPFARAAVTALVEWWDTDSSYDPRPVLGELAPSVTHWFAVALVNDCRYEIKSKAVTLLNELVINAWVRPDSATEEVRYILDEFGPVAIKVILEEDAGEILTEALRFLDLFQLHYCPEDRLMFEPLWEANLEEELRESDPMASDLLEQIRSFWTSTD